MNKVKKVYIRNVQNIKIYIPNEKILKITWS